jgi:hypothetical protein
VRLENSIPARAVGVENWCEVAELSDPVLAPVRCLVLVPPSHGENRGSSPLGSANNINDLHFRICQCPVRVPSRFWARERRLDNSISMRLLSRRSCFSQEGLGARRKASRGLDSSVGGLTV